MPSQHATVTVSVRMTKAECDRLDEAAARAGVKRHKFIRNAIARELASQSAETEKTMEITDFNDDPTGFVPASDAEIARAAAMKGKVAALIAAEPGIDAETVAARLIEPFWIVIGVIGVLEDEGAVVRREDAFFPAR